MAEPKAPQTTPRWAWLIIIPVGILVIYGMANRPRTPAAPPRSATVRVDYVVKGTARRADITYRNADGGIEQREVAVPWETRIDVPHGAFASISAQNKGGGTISCTIYVDSSEAKTATSEGEYKIASCSDRVP